MVVINLLQQRIRFSTECKHCGVKTDEFWLWEHQVKDKYICGNCQFQEVVLTGVKETHEIDPLKPK
ncbi:hypothetical protein JUJ52_11085 [Virgibacillus sp. AGTR]|uniref:hypothetical protein n=1 Tax=Virgibacillus sp. AGTR TaxID=2812055 RepID=UPI001D16EA2A|nr:hypothetical protein [Virgibacillus sp. AGTR]MCC2250505.1 hypothetical protein [Virgibacillus sp. AGTR]